MVVVVVVAAVAAVRRVHQQPLARVRSRRRWRGGNKQPSARARLALSRTHHRAAGTTTTTNNNAPNAKAAANAKTANAHGGVVRVARQVLGGD